MERKPNPHPAALRVRIHLNLAQPSRAENVVRVQSPSGAWVAIAYATELLLANVLPVVDRKVQERISHGQAKKTPHAFLEGDLVHFKGRLRPKAPPALLRRASPLLVASSLFAVHQQEAADQGELINYNPRFASCFFKDKDCHADISERLIGCPLLVAVGWKFWAMDGDFTPLLSSDRCSPDALLHTSAFERVALARGRQATEEKLLTPRRPKA